MSTRSTRRRLNRAFERDRRRHEEVNEVGACPGLCDPRSLVVARTRQTITSVLTALLVLAALGVMVSYLQQRRIAVLGDRLGDLARAMASSDVDMKKFADAADRALAAANRQAAASEVANKITRDALVASRRAWVGVVGARIEGQIASNADLTVAVSYRNSGHEPATDLAAIATPFVLESEKRAEPQTLGRLQQFADRCMTENYVGGGIAFPSGEAQTSQIDAIVKASDVDYALVEGRKLIIVEACIVYISGGAVHHSASCYYFQGGRTPPDRFSLCAKGAAAD